VLANRAACWLMVDEAQRAVEDCRKASDVIEEQLPNADAEERSRLVSQRSKVATRLSSSLQRLGRIDEALAVIDAAREHDPSLEKKRIQLEQCQSTQQSASEAYEGEEYSRAKRCFVKLRDDYNVTDDPDARVKLAACHVHLKEYADGSREALSALATKKLRGKSLVEAHGVRADALLAQGDRSRAEQHLAACLQLDPDNSDIKTRLKHLRRSTKDAERIKTDIESLVRKGDYDKASTAASEGLKVDPSDKKLTAAMHVRRAKCHQLLALKVLRSNGDRDQRQDKALPHWRRVHADSSAALYHAPAPLKTAYLLGAEALQGMNRYGDAVDLLETALNTLPDGKSDRDLIQKFKTAQRLLKKAQRPDLYKLIGQDLDEHSDESAIKKAYKKAAMKWHPDRFSCKGEKQQKEAEEQFQKINDAYEFLTDSQRKRLWDQGYDREEIEQQLEMQKQQYRGGGFPFGGFRRG
jgi:tetratricopeptide (TPR) repeat protein